MLERELRNPWHRKFAYKRHGKRNPKGYELLSVGRDGKIGTADDIRPE